MPRSYCGCSLNVSIKMLSDCGTVIYSVPQSDQFEVYGRFETTDNTDLPNGAVVAKKTLETGSRLGNRAPRGEVWVLGERVMYDVRAQPPPVRTPQHERIDRHG